jgi:hypothetical protein
LVTYKLRDFWYERKRKAKTYTIENELLAWNDMVVWKDFRLSYISETVWVDYTQHVMSTFHLTIIVQCGEPAPTPACSKILLPRTSAVHSIHFACEADGKIIFITFIFLFVIFL